MLLVKHGGLFQLTVFEVHSPRLGGPNGSASGDHVLGGRVLRWYRVSHGKREHKVPVEEGSHVSQRLTENGSAQLCLL